MSGRHLSRILVAIAIVAAAILPVGEDPSPAAAQTSTRLDGYWMVDARGHVHAFGNAPHLGEGVNDTVGLAATRDGRGYWLAAGDGTIIRRGTAPDLGPRIPLLLGERVVAILGDPSTAGAWIVTSRGAVHNRGGARGFGDTSGRVLNRPIIAAVATPRGDGYWLVGEDGGVFTFGSARFHGSMGGRHLNAPVMGMVPTSSSRGYWLVASDGGIFSFGDARFHGSMGGTPLNRPITGMVGAGRGYLMVAEDGGVFTFGPGVRFHGSLGDSPPPHRVVAISPVPAGQDPPPLGPNPPFVSDVRAATSDRTWASWRPGCPVPLSDLRLVTVDHWDMSGRLRTGELVVHRSHAAGIVDVMRELHRIRFPIERMELVDLYWGSDDASMAANNTSAFNCRRVTGGTSFSEHSWGTAIDINPIQNPYVRGGTVLPPAGRSYLDRSHVRPGMIVGGDGAVAAFARIGWTWGGNWSSLKDYQHFSATGR